MKTYTCDANGNRASFKLSVGGETKQSAAYTYSLQNRLTAMTEGSRTTAYTYNANGSVLTEQVKENGAQKLRTTYTYNYAGLPTAKKIMHGANTAAKNIVLAFEVSNLTNGSLYFKEFNFNIKVSDKITDMNSQLTAVPHIEAEKSGKRKEIVVNGITGGRQEFLTGIVTNPSSKIEYKDVGIAIIRRTQNNEAVSVMTAKIDSIKPKEQLKFSAEDVVKGREIDPGVIITTLQNFAYVLP